MNAFPLGYPTINDLLPSDPNWPMFNPQWMGQPTSTAKPQPQPAQTPVNQALTQGMGMGGPSVTDAMAGAQGSLGSPQVTQSPVQGPVQPASAMGQPAQPQMDLASIMKMFDWTPEHAAASPQQATFMSTMFGINPRQPNETTGGAIARNILGAINSPLVGIIQRLARSQSAYNAGADSQNAYLAQRSSQDFQAAENARQQRLAEQLWAQHFGQEAKFRGREALGGRMMDEYFRQNAPPTPMERAQMEQMKAGTEIARSESERKSKYDEVRMREIDTKIAKTNAEIEALKGKLSVPDAEDVESLQKEFSTAFSIEEKARILGEIRAITGRYRKGGQQAAPTAPTDPLGIR